MAQRMAAMRLRPGYERLLGQVKSTLPKAPVVGRPLYSALHAAKTAVKDWLLPQTMFADLGLKYVGPVDGHDIAALEVALRRARDFRGPVLVHCVTRKGQGYHPAETDDAEQMHSPPAFDPITGKPRAAATTTWTQVFGREMVLAGAERPDVVAITAAMCGPTGLVPFATAFPDRVFDVGIAEQHAVTSAAGLAMGGMHPVVAVYATFLNRAFDQLLMDCALHRLGGDRGPGSGRRHRRGRPESPWHVGHVAGRDRPRVAAGGARGTRPRWPRNWPRRWPSRTARPCYVSRKALCRRIFRQFVGSGWPSPPPTGRPLPDLHPGFSGVDVLAEPAAGRDRDVLLVAVGAFGGLAVEAAQLLAAQGIGVTVVDPRWALPVPAEISTIAADHQLVVTVEDGGRSGASAPRSPTGWRGPVSRSGCWRCRRNSSEPGSRAELLSDLGLTAKAVARGITEQIARQTPDPGSGRSASPLTGGRDPAADG